MSVEILLSSSHNLNSESYILRYFSMRIIHIALTPILFLLLTCMSCGKIELLNRDVKTCYIKILLILKVMLAKQKQKYSNKVIYGRF